MLTFDLTKIKNYLKLPITFEDDDELIENLFDFCLVDVNKFIGFDLTATTYTDEERLLLSWERKFQTTAFPVLTPVSGDIIIITINDGDSIGLDSFTYDLKGNINFTSTLNLSLGVEHNKIKVTYKAGFDTFPESVEYAVYKLIRNEYREGGNEIQSSGDLSSNESKREVKGNMPVDVYRMLAPYRRGIA